MIWKARKGIIPANTGRISSSQRPLRPQRDHPREYGENLSISRLLILSLGSSPRIRGESCVGGCRPCRHGIIPANTGRMQTGAASGYGGPDHPREYGENHILSDIWDFRHGSSPRIRGESRMCSTLRPASGIIPANTGRIFTFFIHRRLDADHPREYGENCPEPTLSENQLGSSPRIRGEWPHMSTMGFRSGIIPANTGRMWPFFCRRQSHGDHPREYGENTLSR